MSPQSTPILTIAGTDPSGGAGIQADLKTFAAHGCYGMSAITALVAQNTQGVQGIHASPPEFVAQQIRCVLDDVPARAIKTGMLTDEATVKAVLDTLAAYSPLPPLVVDPVMVSTSGHSLLEPGANSLIKRKLFPLAAIITPNIPEAERILELASGSIKTISDMTRATGELGKLGARAILVKGGHLKFSSANVLSSGVANVRWDVGCGPDQPEILRLEDKKWVAEEESVVVDVLYLPASAECTAFVRPRLETTSTHGTGCTLSAALACAFAQGLSAFDAVIQATRYTHQAIATAPGLGKGRGPLNHGHSVVARVIPQPTPGNPYPFTSALINSCTDLWRQYVEHPFVAQLAAGTLPRKNFVHYLKQDYIYLKHYARAHGLLAAKSSDFAAIGAAAEIVLHIARESKMHVDYLTEWGVTPAELAATPELPPTAAYARYMMDVGLLGDDYMLILAVASCLLGYAEVGKRLKLAGAGFEGNPYKRWIDDYSGSEFQEALQRGLDLMERRAAADPPSVAQFARLQDVWERCVRFEIGFWDMGMSI